MSRYDDPQWYEEQPTEPAQQKSVPIDDFAQHPYPSYPESGSQAPTRYVRPLSSGDSRHRIGQRPSQFIVTVLFVALAFGGGWFSHQLFGNSFDASNSSRSYSQLFQEAWTDIDQGYVDRKAIDYKAMSYAAIDAMVKSLKDKGHTRFLTPDQVKSQNQALSGELIGIGINLSQDPQTKQLIISSPIPGSPAEKAGLQHGDVILAVNGISTSGKDITGVSQLIKGDAGTSVTLTIQRINVAHPLTIKVKRAKILVPNVLLHYIPEDHIAHIQVIQFSSGISGQLKDAVTKAKGMGATKIILDLRDNPGGFLNEAIDTTSLFVKSGNVLLTQDSSGHRTPMPVTGSSIDTTDAIVILTNENSASAAEIVSGALQDSKRAIIIGEKTFGTGTVLQQISLSDGSALLLGEQEWLTPKGKFIRDNGIQPDVTIPLAANATPLSPNEENTAKLTEQQILHSSDAQLVAAIKYLQHH